MSDAFEKARDRSPEIPKGIVVHPAAAGRQLAWAAARVDFWFRDVNGAFDEITAVGGDVSGRRNLIERSPRAAVTWQFFERDSQIALLSSSGASPWPELQVWSHYPGAEADLLSPAHFSVTLFAQENSRPGQQSPDGTPGLRRMPEAELQVEPLLDRLFLQHPDFMRLNDYSEALSILRWVRDAGAPLTVIDALGVPADTSPPRWVFGTARGLDITVAK